MRAGKPYQTRQFNLGGLEGISDETLEIHFKLYDGYVKETNRLNEQIAEILKGGKVDQEEIPAYSELTRRLGFEFNGMVMHEHYFGNLKARSPAEPGKTSDFRKSVEASFGSFDLWKADFTGVGKMRGVGWAITFRDPSTNRLSNHWITLHENGSVAGYQPVLVMDVWEHAFLLDYKPSGRAKYIEVFFKNVDWNALDGRCRQAEAA